MAPSPSVSAEIYRRRFSGNQRRASISYEFVKLIVSASTRSSPAAHSIVFKLGLLSNVFIASALVDAYCKSRKMKDAEQMFEEMNSRNAVAWNSLIRGHSKAGSPAISTKIFAEMVAEGVAPTPFTISIALLACSALEAEGNGAMVHCVAVKYGLCSNVVVGSSLVDMYSKCCSSMDDSQKLFDEMRDRNVITWTSIITGYAAHQRPENAMDLLREMKLAGLSPSEVTFSGLLGSLADRHCLVYGEQIHSLSIRQGIEANPYLSSALIAMYSKCGSSEYFLKLVDSNSSEDQVLQNSIVSGFSHLRNLAEAMAEFIRMKRRSMYADFYTFGSLLWAAGSDSALEEGRQVHALVLRTGFCSSIYVQNGLIAMYARCGEIDDSKLAFSEICSPDLVSCNSLISGFARHGQARHALELFDKMRSRGVDPDETTFLSLLSACGHAGLVDQGLRCFNRMADSVDGPIMKHYSSLIDLLGRAGYLNQAKSLVNAIPVDQKSNPSIYRSLVNSCKNHGDMEAAMKAVDGLLQVCTHESSTYVLASNVFAEMRQWGNSAAVRDQMAERGLKKEPGKSWIDGGMSG